MLYGIWSEKLLLIANSWNCLPYYVTDANTVDIFMLRLDKFWKDQDVSYDFTCDIAGTGDRSEY